MKRGWSSAAVLAAGILLAAQAHATTVFSDNFNDNDVSDWSFSTNHGTSAGIDVGGILGPYIDAPPGGIDLIARASHDVSLAQAGDYTLDLDAFAIHCQGCTVSFDVLFDGSLLLRQATDGAWTHETLNLGALAAGDHVLQLGMHTTNASSGHFQAQFDNVVIDGENLSGPAVPEPAAWALMIVGFGGAGAMLRRRRSAVPA